MITIKQNPQYLYYAGSTFTVEWYMNEAGEMKACEYYESLSKDEQKRLYYIVRYFADSPLGTHLPKTLYNLEDAENKIYAFKPKDYRFFNFMTAGKKVIIVDGYRKHSQKMGKKDLHLLDAVVQAKNSYLKRAEEGTYYERPS
jgi:hypothetical protein